MPNMNVIIPEDDNSAGSVILRKLGKFKVRRMGRVFDATVITPEQAAQVAPAQAEEPEPPVDASEKPKRKKKAK